ncbi:hypothetical protein DSOL_5069 [Desulfosporosinus metallidurans]|uniref:Uncharacterized protein n=1 Tax=Desulfosporosinus metallidurans TaxID=1888891 RepID=A0A1Q8QFZ1_9FIRM|nr:hypothetical protein DSOL_5069 [Desulfosporosinus metallidurans]
MERFKGRGLEYRNLLFIRLIIALTQHSYYTYIFNQGTPWFFIAFS